MDEANYRTAKDTCCRDISLGHSRCTNCIDLLGRTSKFTIAYGHHTGTTHAFRDRTPKGHNLINPAPRQPVSWSSLPWDITIASSAVITLLKGASADENARHIYYPKHPYADRTERLRHSLKPPLRQSPSTACTSVSSTDSVGMRAVRGTYMTPFTVHHRPMLGINATTNLRPRSRSPQPGHGEATVHLVPSLTGLL